MGIKIYSRLVLVLAFTTFVLNMLAQGTKTQGTMAQGNGAGYTLIELQADTLPSLNVSRTAHTTLWLNGELTVFGGHTDGFVPTPTAEYFSDGAWHTVPLVYPHDGGIAIELRSGKVFLAGGHKEALGIGQLFSAEMYDPASHTSRGFGCMDKKRVYANATEMADGQVVISGNWFADDGIEMFENVDDSSQPNAVKIKDSSLPRTRPYILRIADDDAIIFNSLDTEHNNTDASIVDRLNGPSYHEPFMDTWKPIRTFVIQRSYNQFVGNEADSHYEWLLPVENDETHEVAIARVKGGGKDGSVAEFSLLETQQSLPDSINGNQIVYSSLMCDRDRKLAYLIGNDDDARIYVVAVPYDTAGAAPITVYVTDPQPIVAKSTTPALTPEGDLIFAGGFFNTNFEPSNSVIRIPLGPTDDTQAAAPATARSSQRWRGWIVIACLIAGAAAVIITARRKKTKASTAPDYEPEEPDAIEDDILDQNLPKEEILADLYKQIELLMDEEHLYLNPDLRTSDVAAHIGTNSAYVSAAINSQCGCSFSQFLTKYRISYAQQLMREHPDSKLSSISEMSGFNYESTFFRVFRAATGMSPKEWLASLHEEK